MIEDNIQKKTLSIRVSTNGFCFCSYIPSQPQSLQYFFFEPETDTTIAANLAKAIEECPFSTKGCSIKAIIETNEYTTLPAEFDNKEDYKLYYRYCFPNSNSAIEILSNRLNAHSLTIIFPVEKATYETLQQLGDVTYYTPISILAGYLTRCPLPEEKYLLAYVNGDYSALLPINNGMAGTSNMFKSNDCCNTLFYLLSTWKAQGFSQTEDTLYLCGDKGIEGLQPECARFIKNIKRLNPNALFNPTLLNRLKDIPFDLQALILCE